MPELLFRWLPAHITPGLVSCIIPVYNRSSMLREAVGSVTAQTYSSYEVIIVDDGSTDSTLAICAQLAESDPERICIISSPNRGPGCAREKGRQLARGEYIQYLDSDDLLLPRKFEHQVAALQQNPDCDVAYCFTRFHRIGQGFHPTPWKGSGNAVASMFPSFLVDRWWDTPNPLYRRSICDAAGPWSDLRLEEDWEYDCRIAALGAKLVHCPEYLVEVRDHDGGRLSRGAAHDATRNRERARARRLIYESAMRAGITTDQPEMRFFARSLFLLARQCGASGLARESQELFALARKASGTRRGNSLDFRLYQSAAACLGWTAMGRFSCWLDRFRMQEARA